MASVKINELGEKSNKEKYSCRACKREVSLQDARQEAWHYCIEGKEDAANQSFGPEAVEYVCQEHYRTLSAEESPRFVEIGYPYFSSLLIDNKNISTF